MNQSVSSLLHNYACQREALLERISAGLQSDARITTAWLGGSYGRGEQDAVSDLDLYAVIEEKWAQHLCARLTMICSGSPEPCLRLFSQFGEPVNIHENHRNAPLEWLTLLNVWLSGQLFSG